MDIHLEAEIYLMTAEEGGRRTPFHNGYRPSFRYGDAHNDVFVTLLDRDEMSGGETALVHITFVRPEFQNRRLFTGLEFALTEASRAIARGSIKRIFAPSMVTELERRPDSAAP